jgi:hypothetical protein
MRRRDCWLGNSADRQAQHKSHVPCDFANFASRPRFNPSLLRLQIHHPDVVMKLIEVGDNLVLGDVQFHVARTGKARDDRLAVVEVLNGERSAQWTFAFRI